MAALLALLLGIGLGYLLFGNSNSKRYRKTLTDLTVVGKLKQIAKSKNIDLAHELDNFKTFTKRKRITSLNLDESIEEGIQFDLEKELQIEDLKK